MNENENFLIDVLKCIDYEYGAPNYSAYDIANHFDEFCGVEEVDYNLYPSKVGGILFPKISIRC